MEALCENLPSTMSVFNNQTSTRNTQQFPSPPKAIANEQSQANPNKSQQNQSLMLQPPKPSSTTTTTTTATPPQFERANTLPINTSYLPQQRSTPNNSVNSSLNNSSSNLAARLGSSLSSFDSSTSTSDDETLCESDEDILVDANGKPQRSKRYYGDITQALVDLTRLRPNPSSNFAHPESIYNSISNNNLKNSQQQQQQQQSTQSNHSKMWLQILQQPHSRMLYQRNLRPYPGVRFHAPHLSSSSSSSSTPLSQTQEGIGKSRGKTEKQSNSYYVRVSLIRERDGEDVSYLINGNRMNAIVPSGEAEFRKLKLTGTTKKSNSRFCLKFTLHKPNNSPHPQLVPPQQSFLHPHMPSVYQSYAMGFDPVLDEENREIACVSESFEVFSHSSYLSGSLNGDIEGDGVSEDGMSSSGSAIKTKKRKSLKEDSVLRTSQRNLVTPILPLSVSADSTNISTPNLKKIYNPFSTQTMSLLPQTQSPSQVSTLSKSLTGIPTSNSSNSSTPNRSSPTKDKSSSQQESQSSLSELSPRESSETLESLKKKCVSQQEEIDQLKEKVEDITTFCQEQTSELTHVRMMLSTYVDRASQFHEQLVEAQAQLRRATVSNIENDVMAGVSAVAMAAIARAKESETATTVTPSQNSPSRSHVYSLQVTQEPAPRMIYQRHMKPSPTVALHINDPQRVPNISTSPSDSFMLELSMHRYEGGDDLSGSLQGNRIVTIAPGGEAIFKAIKTTITTIKWGSPFYLKFTLKKGNEFVYEDDGSEVFATSIPFEVFSHSTYLAPQPQPIVKGIYPNVGPAFARASLGLSVSGTGIGASLSSLNSSGVNNIDDDIGLESPSSPISNELSIDSPSNNNNNTTTSSTSPNHPSTPTPISPSSHPAITLTSTLNTSQSSLPLVDGKPCALLGNQFIQSGDLRVKFGNVEVKPHYHENGTLLVVPPFHPPGVVLVTASNDGVNWSSTSASFTFLDPREVKNT